jgi:general secretion pathway protein A
MYQEFYGLRERPFELTANTRFLFLTHRQREALSILEYGLLSAKSLTLLIGDAGTGKTTLLQAALESERCRAVHCVYLNNPMLSAADFVALLASRFQLGDEAGRSKSVLLDRLDAKLRQSRVEGQVTALVIDEAQSLSTELLEEVRLLANMETETDKLLPVVGAGPQELAERLEEPNLRQLKQRVALRCELEPFTLDDSAAYIARRIHAAGGVPAEMFTQEAVRLIHERAAGIPRVINVICDNALVSGMALGRRRVERAVVTEVCEDLRLPDLSTRSKPFEVEQTPMRSAMEPVMSPLAELAAGDEATAAGDPPGASSRFNFRFRWKTPTPLSSPAKVAE